MNPGVKSVHKHFKGVFSVQCVLIMSFSILLWSSNSGAGQSEALTATELRCDYLDSPQGIDHQTPNFGWVLTSDERGQYQKAYQVLVYDSEENLMWDSGKIVSSESSHVKYAGKPLKSSSNYYWKVRVWDRNDQTGLYTDLAHFGTALMDIKEWKAQWIGRGPAQEAVVRWGTDFEKKDLEQLKELVKGNKLKLDFQSTLLRKEILAKRPIQQAKIHISGLGLFELYVNGSKIGHNREHVPLRTLYSSQILYSTFDITDKLNKGSNVIGIMLGNGWFNPQEKYWNWRMQWCGFPKAIAQITVEYADGSEEIIVSDQSWKTSPGPVVSSCLFDGEFYDAALEQAGWDRTGFDDSQWQGVHLVQSPGGTLVSQLAPPITVTEIIKPVNVKEISSGVFVFDLGQNFSGWARLSCKGPKGTKVQLRYAEDINEDGTLNRKTLRHAENTDTYIFKGNGSIEVYEPHFTCHGFRYVEITGYPGIPALDTVQGCVAHSNCEITGKFECDNDLINHIYHCAFWSQRSVMQGLPVDCPQRDERLGWGADAHVQAESSMFAFDTHQFYAKWLRDFQVQQSRETGNLPHIVPWPWLEGHPCWSAAYPLTVWYCYLYYGDKQLVACHYDNIKKYVDYLKSQSHCHIQPRDDSGDWMSAVEKVRGGPLLISTAFYYCCTRITADSAKVLGKTEDAEQYNKMAEEIAAAWNRVFLRDSARRGYPYGENSQCENALSLFFDIVPDRARERVVGNLIRDIQDRGHLTTGFIGTKYTMEALTQIDRPDVGYQLMILDTPPSWGNMTQGRTTMSETWTGGGSGNHAGLGGGVISWMFKTLAGINPDPEKPGFERILIKPYIPGDLNYVKASLRTIKGGVESSWEKNDGEITLKVSIPVNATARVCLPAVDPLSIQEGDNKAEKSPGVHYCGKEKDKHIYEIESGHYVFVFDDM